MLAQPQGLTAYDQRSWSGFAAPTALAGGVLWVGLLSFVTSDVSEFVVPEPQNGPSIAADEDHMAHFGAVLYARHLVSVEVVATILLAALVGAIAIVIHGREPPPTGGATQSGERSASGDQEGADA
jgi:NADH:ubiquinone oxidoreductase subunit 6 (subunit J)